MDERIQKYEDKMKKTLSSLESELATIRAGRANPHILDKLTVDYYGAPTPLQQVANITVPEARMIQIQPWESSLIKGIEKAILTSDLGLNPSNDGKVIRLVFPELTEERRKELVKDVKKKGEPSGNSPIIFVNTAGGTRSTSGSSSLTSSGIHSTYYRGRHQDGFKSKYQGGFRRTDWQSGT